MAAGVDQPSMSTSSGACQYHPLSTRSCIITTHSSHNRRHTACCTLVNPPSSSPDDPPPNPPIKDQHLRAPARPAGLQPQQCVFSGSQYPSQKRIAPQDANYWGYIYPSMMCATIGIDVTFNVCNIHITTNTSRNQQGFVGAIIAFLLHCGSTTCLGLADIIKRETRNVLRDRKSC